jgi:hypothetical protein
VLVGHVYAENALLPHGLHTQGGRHRTVDSAGKSDDQSSTLEQGKQPLNFMGNQSDLFGTVDF